MKRHWSLRTIALFVTLQLALPPQLFAQMDSAHLRPQYDRSGLEEQFATGLEESEVDGIVTVSATPISRVRRAAVPLGEDTVVISNAETDSFALSNNRTTVQRWTYGADSGQFQLPWPAEAFLVVRREFFAVINDPFEEGGKYLLRGDAQTGAMTGFQELASSGGTSLLSAIANGAVLVVAESGTTNVQLVDITGSDEDGQALPESFILPIDIPGATLADLEIRAIGNLEETKELGIVFGSSNESDEYVFAVWGAGGDDGAPQLMRAGQVQLSGLKDLSFDGSGVIALTQEGTRVERLALNASETAEAVQAIEPYTLHDAIPPSDQLVVNGKSIRAWSASDQRFIPLSNREDDVGRLQGFVQGRDGLVETRLELSGVRIDSLGADGLDASKREETPIEGAIGAILPPWIRQLPRPDAPPEPLSTGDAWFVNENSPTEIFEAGAIRVISADGTPKVRWLSLAQFEAAFGPSLDIVAGDVIQYVPIRTAPHASHQTTVTHVSYDPVTGHLDRVELRETPSIDLDGNLAENIAELQENFLERLANAVRVRRVVNREESSVQSGYAVFNRVQPNSVRLDVSEQTRNVGFGQITEYITETVAHLHMALDVSDIPEAIASDEALEAFAQDVHAALVDLYSNIHGVVQMGQVVFASGENPPIVQANPDNNTIEIIFTPQARMPQYRYDAKQLVGFLVREQGVPTQNELLRGPVSRLRVGDLVMVRKPILGTTQGNNTEEPLFDADALFRIESIQETDGVVKTAKLVAHERLELDELHVANEVSEEDRTDAELAALHEDLSSPDVSRETFLERLAGKPSDAWGLLAGDLQTHPYAPLSEDIRMRYLARVEALQSTGHDVYRHIDAAAIDLLVDLRRMGVRGSMEIPEERIPQMIEETEALLAMPNGPEKEWKFFHMLGYELFPDEVEQLVYVFRMSDTTPLTADGKKEAPSEQEAEIYAIAKGLRKAQVSDETQSITFGKLDAPKFVKIHALSREWNRLIAPLEGTADSPAVADDNDGFTLGAVASVKDALSSGERSQDTTVTINNAGANESPATVMEFEQVDRVPVELIPLVPGETRLELNYQELAHSQVIPGWAWLIVEQVDAFFALLNDEDQMGLLGVTRTSAGEPIGIVLTRVKQAIFDGRLDVTQIVGNLYQVLDAVQMDATELTPAIALLQQAVAATPQSDYQRQATSLTSDFNAKATDTMAKDVTVDEDVGAMAVSDSGGLDVSLEVEPTPAPSFVLPAAMSVVGDGSFVADTGVSAPIDIAAATAQTSVWEVSSDIGNVDVEAEAAFVGSSVAGSFVDAPPIDVVGIGPDSAAMMASPSQSVTVVIGDGSADTVAYEVSDAGHVVPVPSTPVVQSTVMPLSFDEPQPLTVDLLDNLTAWAAGVADYLSISGGFSTTAIGSTVLSVAGVDYRVDLPHHTVLGSHVSDVGVGAVATEGLPAIDVAADLSLGGFLAVEQFRVDSGQVSASWPVVTEPEVILSSNQQAPLGDAFSSAMDVLVAQETDEIALPQPSVLSDLNYGLPEPPVIGLNPAFNYDAFSYVDQRWWAFTARTSDRFRSRAARVMFASAVVVWAVIAGLPSFYASSGNVQAGPGIVKEDTSWNLGQLNAESLVFGQETLPALALDQRTGAQGQAAPVAYVYMQVGRTSYRLISQNPLEQDRSIDLNPDPNMRPMDTGRRIVVVQTADQEVPDEIDIADDQPVATALASNASFADVSLRASIVYVQNDGDTAEASLVVDNFNAGSIAMPVSRSERSSESSYQQAQAWRYVRQDDGTYARHSAVPFDGNTRGVALPEIPMTDLPRPDAVAPDWVFVVTPTDWEPPASVPNTEGFADLALMTQPYMAVSAGAQGSTLLHDQTTLRMQLPPFTYERSHHGISLGPLEAAVYVQGPNGYELVEHEVKGKTTTAFATGADHQLELPALGEGQALGEEPGWVILLSSSSTQNIGPKLPRTLANLSEVESQALKTPGAHIFQGVVHVNKNGAKVVKDTLVTRYRLTADLTVDEATFALPPNFAETFAGYHVRSYSRAEHEGRYRWTALSDGVAVDTGTHTYGYTRVPKEVNYLVFYKPGEEPPAEIIGDQNSVTAYPIFRFAPSGNVQSRRVYLSADPVKLPKDVGREEGEALNQVRAASLDATGALVVDSSIMGLEELDALLGMHPGFGARIVYHTPNAAVARARFPQLRVASSSSDVASYLMGMPSADRVSVAGGEELAFEVANLVAGVMEVAHIAGYSLVRWLLALGVPQFVLEGINQDALQGAFEQLRSA